MDLKTYPLQRWTQGFKSNREISWSATLVGAAVVLESAVSGFSENSLITSGQCCCLQYYPSAELKGFIEIMKHVNCVTSIY